MGHGRLAVACALTALIALVSGTVLVAAPHPAAAASCPDLTPAAGAIRVLAAGDSITQGSSGDFTWRYRLWQHLRASGTDVDLVGPFDFMYDNLTNVFGNHDYADPCFDQSHYAMGGSTYESMLAPPKVSPGSSSGINWAVSSYHPDVVIQLAGANDLRKGATVDDVLARAKAFLDEIRAANPSATVVMVTLPTVQLPEVVPEYNTRLAAAVPTWSTPESRVVLADPMRYWAGAADTWDGWHPNSHGEMHIAAAIEDAFHELGLGDPSVQPVPDVPLGPRVPTALAVQPGDAAVTLTWVAPPGADREYLWYRDVTAAGAWTPMPGAIGGTGAAVSNLENGRQYAFRAQAAKGSAVATDLFSNVVSATPSAAQDPTQDPSPSPSPTPTDSPTATPTPSASPLPTSTPTPTESPTTTPTGTATPAPTVPAGLDRVGGLTGLPGDHAVVLAWSPVAGATSYSVSWRPTYSDVYASTEIAGAGLTVTGLVAGQSYAFEVQARSGGLLGLPGPEVVVTPAGSVPAFAVATHPHVVAVRRHRLAVSWRPVGAVTRSCVQARPSGGAWTTLGCTAGTRLTTTRLRARLIYAIRVQPWHLQVAGQVSPLVRVRVR